MGGCGHLEQDIAVFRVLEANAPVACEQFARLEILLEFEMKTIHTSIATHKWLLRRRGIFSTSRVRAPGLEFDEAQLSELKQILEHLK